jgi:hypothetical protein
MRRWLGFSFGFASVAALCFAGCTGSSQGSAPPDGGGDGDSSSSDGGATDSANRGDTATGEAATGSDGASGGDSPSGEDLGDAACPLDQLPSPTCNSIVASGPVVTTSFSPGTVPQSQGGIVPDGTYVLQSSTYYDGSGASDTFQTTWVICGDQWDVAYNVMTDGGAFRVHVNYTATLQGSEVALNPSCASMPSVNSPLTFGFSVSSGQITFSQDVEALVLVSTFAQR